MNARIVLGLPWYGPHLTQRWIWWTLTGVLWLAALVMAYTTHPLWPDGWIAAASLLAFWIAAMAFLFASTLRMALEARRMCLPRLERVAALSVGLDALVLLALSTLALALLSGHPAAMIEVLAIGLAGGLAYALLPALWVVMAFLAVPAVQSLAALWHWHFIGAQDPRFIEVSLVFVGLCVALSVWRWQVVLNHADRSLGWASRPLVLGAGWGGQCGAWARAAPDGAGTGRAGSRVVRWLRPPIELRGAGPSNPTLGLRVALGLLYLPVTVHKILTVVVVSVLLAAVLALVNLPQFAGAGWPWAAAAHLAGIIVLAALVVPIVVGAVVRAQHLQQRWRKPSGELALLPLLPNFTAPGAQSAQLLRVVFARLSWWHGPLIAGALLIEALATHDVNRTVVLGLLLGLAPAFEVALVYVTLGRFAVPRWAYAGVLLLGEVVLFGGFSVVVLVGEAPPTWLLPALTCACALCYVVLATLATLGKRALGRQPHPYLALE